MIAIRAQYNEGKIELLEPIPPEITHAKLNIVVIPEATGIQDDSNTRESSDSLKDFQSIGMQDFFDIEDDKNVNWEEVFGIQEKKG